MSEFVEQGLAFFRACNSFFAAIGAFVSDPLKYLIAYGFWISVFVSVVSVFLKACGFKSEKYFMAGTLGSFIFKVMVLMR